jgi:hypothetical protein
VERGGAERGDLDVARAQHQAKRVLARVGEQQAALHDRVDRVPREEQQQVVLGQPQQRVVEIPERLLVERLRYDALAPERPGAHIDQRGRQRRCDGTGRRDEHALAAERQLRLADDREGHEGGAGRGEQQDRHPPRAHAATTRS